jgi:hypothetical protein
MRKYLPFLLFVLLQVQVSAQNKAESIFIWQGFEQYWGYNHRINCLGDWIERDSAGENVTQHFAASGSGSDRLDYVQFSTKVAAPQLGFSEGKTSFDLVGKEGEMIEQRSRESIPFDLEDGWDFELLLSGFELRTKPGVKADKFEVFGIQLLDPKIIEGQLSFEILVQLQMNCSTPECERGNQEVGYALDVYWMAIKAPGMSRQAKIVEQNQSWEKQNSTLPDPIYVAWMLESGKAPAVVGIRGLELFMDEEHHMLGLQMGVEETASASPLLGARLKLGFVQNLPSMFAAYKAYYSGFPKLPAKWVVKGESGSANLRMHLSLLSIPDAEMKAEKVVGDLFWKTRHGKQKASK